MVSQYNYGIQRKASNNSIYLKGKKKGGGEEREGTGFFPSTSCRWKSLPLSIFPASFNLPSFKRQVYHHLKGQMAWFFVNLYFYIYMLLFPFLDILEICFIT